MSMSGGELRVLLALDKLATVVPTYTSIAGTLYQVAADDSVVIDEFYNNSPYTLSATGNTAGQITFTTDGESDVRRTLIFLGPPSQYGCAFKIDNDNNVPLVIVIESVNAVNNALDRRGFGSDGDNPISFELRFYPEI